MLYLQYVRVKVKRVLSCCSYVPTVGHIRWGGCMIYMRVKIKRGIEL